MASLTTDIVNFSRKKQIASKEFTEVVLPTGREAVEWTEYNKLQSETVSGCVLIFFLKIGGAIHEEIE